MRVLCYEILAWKNGSDLFFQNKEKGQLSEVLLCALFGIWYAGFWNPRIAQKKLKLEQNPGISHAMVQAPKVEENLEATCESEYWEKSFET
jgi:hypothetical protein